MLPHPKHRSGRPSTWQGNLAERLSHTWLGPFHWGLIIFASIPLPCATDSISQYHQVRNNFSFAATVSTNQLGLSLLFRSHPFISPTDPTSWRFASCPDLDYGTSVHFTSPSGCQRLFTLAMWVRGTKAYIWEALPITPDLIAQAQDLLNAHFEWIGGKGLYRFIL